MNAQRGSALVIAMLTMLVMLGLGFALLSFVDGQQRDNMRSRAADSSFNLAEGVLDTQVYLLSHNWPGSPSTAHASSCTQASAPAGCPSPTQVRASFTAGDWDAGSTWIAQVRDNGGATASFYSSSLAATQPTWDANGDGRVWTYARATTRGRVRTIVALVEVQRVDNSLVFAHNAITAGWVGTTNNGKKVIIDTQGDSGQPGPVAVRCTTRTPSCLDYQANKGQIAPDTTQTGYAGGNALSDDRIDTLRQRAIAMGTYWATGCPANPSGPIVFVETADCSYNNSAGPCCNSAASPGVLVFGTGTLTLNGNIIYNGIVYMANRNNQTGRVLYINGTAAVNGAIAIDGAGGLYAGSSAVNVTFASGAFNALAGFGTAGVIQNTWRELTT